MNPEMVNTLGFYDINEFRWSPAVKNCQAPNYNY